MIKLDKIGAGNAPPLPKNTIIVVATDYNKVVEKVNEIIDTIAVGSGGSAAMSKKTVDMSVSGAQVIIGGSTFTPPITSEPSIFRALMINGSTITDVSETIEGFQKNGIYYDVIVNPLEDQYLNVKITVI